MGEMTFSDGELIACPWCGSENGTTDYDHSKGGERVDCVECGKAFQLTADYDVTYSAMRLPAPDEGKEADDG